MSDLTFEPEQVSAPRRPARRSVVQVGYDRFLMSDEDALTLIRIARRSVMLKRPDYDYRREVIPPYEPAEDGELTVSIELALVAERGHFAKQRERDPLQTIRPDVREREEAERRAIEAAEQVRALNPDVPHAEAAE